MTQYKSVIKVFRHLNGTDEFLSEFSSNGTVGSDLELDFNENGEIIFSKKDYANKCGALVCQSGDDSVLDAFPICSKKNSISSLERIKEINAQYKVVFHNSTS